MLEILKLNISNGSDIELLYNIKLYGKINDPFPFAQSMYNQLNCMLLRMRH